MLKIFVIILLLLILWYIFIRKNEHLANNVTWNNTKKYTIKMGEKNALYFNLKDNNAFVFTDKKNEAQLFNIKYNRKNDNNDGIFTIDTTNKGQIFKLGIKDGSLTLQKGFSNPSQTNFYLDNNNKIYILEEGTAKYLNSLLQFTPNAEFSVKIHFE